MGRGQQKQPEEDRVQRRRHLRDLAGGLANMGGAKARWAEGNYVGAAAQGLKGAFQVGGAAAKLNPGLAAATTAVPTLLTSLASMPRLLRDFGAGLVENRRHLAALNGGMAAAVARLEAERFGRDVNLAGMTQRSGSRQTQSQSRLEEATLPWQAAGQNLKNNIASGFQNAGAWLLEHFNKLPVVKEMLDYLANEKAKNGTAGNLGPLGDFSKAIADGKYNGTRRFKPLPKTATNTKR
jgi:hypothetical protein